MKMFTYATNRSTVSEWHRRNDIIKHQKLSYWGGRKFSAALLLHSDDDEDPITDADLEAFANNETVQTLFPRGVIAVPSDETEGDWLLAENVDYAGLPDAAQLDTPAVRLFHAGKPHMIDLRQRYNNCRSLIKAVGCKECPEQGITCMQRALPPEQQVGLKVVNGDYDAQDADRVDEDSFKEQLRNRETKIGEFTYISPSLTVPEGHHFTPGLRHYKDHDFSQISDNSEKISERNKRAARDRKFRKENCSVCPVDKICKAYRSCEGPYPSEEVITQKTLERYKDALASTAPFEPWQFWALARLGNIEGTYKRNSSSRVTVRLGGLRHTRDGWTVDLWRSKTSIYEVGSVSDYETLKGIFGSGLPSSKEGASYYERPPSDRALALYLMLSEHKYSRRHKGGWGGDYYSIVARRLYDDHVEIKFGGPRYMRYNESIGSFAAFFREIHSNLKVDHLPRRDTAPKKASLPIVNNG